MTDRARGGDVAVDLERWLDARRAEFDYIAAQIEASGLGDERSHNGHRGLRDKLDAARIKLELVRRVRGPERQRALGDLQRARRSLLDDARAVALRGRRGR